MIRVFFEAFFRLGTCLINFRIDGLERFGDATLVGTVYRFKRSVRFVKSSFQLVFFRTTDLLGEQKSNSRI